jgi:glycosyltransferase involved in cell wall biosynthesis/SAM-dependent methyltransferase
LPPGIPDDDEAWMTPLRITFVLGSLEIGGVERHTVDLATRLVARGHSVHIVSLMAGGPLEDDLQRAQITYEILGAERVIERSASGAVRPIGSLRNVARLVALVPRIRARRPQVVQAFLLWPSVIGLAAATGALVPVRISTRCNLGTDVTATRHPWAERVVPRLAHRTVAVSRAIAATVPFGDAWVIYNGNAARPFAAEVSAQPARGVMVANLIHYKGHADLIRALGLLEDPPVVDCVGEGPERANLEELIADERLEGVVRLRGRSSDPSAFYHRAQFALLPSREEGFGNAALEAMAAGLPIIATQVGGLPEIVCHGETGLLVPPGDPTELAAAIERLASDPALRVRLGTAARADVTDRFSWERCVAAHEQLYAQLLEGSARRRWRGVRTIGPRRRRRALTVVDHENGSSLKKSIATTIARFRRRLVHRNETSASFWDRHYQAGGTSGSGSYGRLAEFKAEVLNDFVRRHDVGSVVELGCGDGNQLGLASYPSYVGLDVSPTAVRSCQATFATDPTKRFAAYRPGELEHRAELALSLDVIYHILEDDQFEQYMRDLFTAGQRFVCVYSNDDDRPSTWWEVRNRRFSTWIDQHVSGWELLEHVPQAYPYDPADEENTSWSSFHFYARSTRSTTGPGSSETFEPS